MMRDFTHTFYYSLLVALQKGRYTFLTFEDFIMNVINYDNIFILRHDVDRKPQNSLAIAKLQHEMGVHGTYYFRIVPESFQPKYIEAIAGLGHEIGYHYEDLTLCKGNVEAAIEHFERSLERLRQYAPINTICMHGSPMTKWDNREIWKHYNYCDFGIMAEPYFDVDFKDVYYLTDTGRRWDGHKVSVRDKVNHDFDFSVRTTRELIATIEEGRAPQKIMQNIHPERWTDDPAEWLWEWSKSAVKNPIKRIVSTFRS